MLLKMAAKITKPFAESADCNRHPILEVLKRIYHVDSGIKNVLEIGSGTGQHAVHFASALEHITWQPSERENYLEGIIAWKSDSNLTNLKDPIVLDAEFVSTWPSVCLANSSTVIAKYFDAVYTSNTFHIMPWEYVCNFIRNLAFLVKPGGLFTVYGAFNYNGSFTTPSNEAFDKWLKSQAEHQGIRHFEQVNELMNNNGWSLVEDLDMPSNNRCITWKLANI